MTFSGNHQPTIRTHAPRVMVRMIIRFLWVFLLLPMLIQSVTAEDRSLLFACEGMSKIIILKENGKIDWEYPAEMSRDAWRLPNGNILFCYNEKYNSGDNTNPSGVMEVTPDKKIVFHFRTTGQVWSCQRLNNGDTLVGAASQGKLLIVGQDGSIKQSIPLRGSPGHSCLRNARQINDGRFIVPAHTANGTGLRSDHRFSPFNFLMLF